MSSIKIKIVILVPLYNEVHRVHHLIDELNTFLNNGHEFNLNFLLVDDGSTDDTFRLADSLILNNQHIKAIGYPHNLGKGHAIRYGFSSLDEDVDYAGFMDADIATPLYHIDGVIKLVKECRIDFIIGNRRSRKLVYDHWLRQIASDLFHQIAISPLHNDYIDTQAGFKFYSRNFFHKIIQTSRVNYFSFDIEHLYLAEKFQFSIYEYFIPDWKNGAHSKVNLVCDGFKMLWSVLRLRLFNL